MVEWIKVGLGAVFTLVAGFWTFFTYTQNELRRSDLAIAAVSDALAVMELNCNFKNDLYLNHLFEQNIEADAKTEGVVPLSERQKTCLKAYLTTYQKTVSGSVDIERPFLVRSSDWETRWQNFYGSLNDARIAGYDSQRIKTAWEEISDLRRGFKLNPD